MNKTVADTFDAAVEFGLSLLDAEARAELARIGYVHPHTKYRVDYMTVVGYGIGLWDGSKSRLLESLAQSQAESLQFYEIDGDRATPEGAMRIILREMAKRAYRRVARRSHGHARIGTEVDPMLGSAGGFHWNEIHQGLMDSQLPG